MKRKKIIITVVAALVMTMGITSIVYAADGFNSKGYIGFAGPDDTNGTSDDIIFDSADLDTIYDQVYTYREAWASAITAKGGTVANAQSFADLQQGILSIPQTIQYETQTGTISYTYHHHSVDGSDMDTDSPDNTTSYNDTYVSPTSGGCYTTPLYKKHQHSGSPNGQGGCYQRAHYYWHTTSHCGGTAELHTSIGGDWQYTCTSCGRWFPSDFGNGHEVTESYDGYSLPGGVTPDRIVWETTCGKTPGVRYTDEGVEGYTLSCGKLDGEISGAHIVFD